MFSLFLSFIRTWRKLLQTLRKARWIFHTFSSYVRTLYVILHFHLQAKQLTVKPAAVSRADRILIIVWTYFTVLLRENVTFHHKRKLQISSLNWGSNWWLNFSQTHGHLQIWLQKVSVLLTKVGGWMHKIHRICTVYAGLMAMGMLSKKFTNYDSRMAKRLNPEAKLCNAW